MIRLPSPQHTPDDLTTHLWLDGQGYKLMRGCASYSLCAFLCHFHVVLPLWALILSLPSISRSFGVWGTASRLIRRLAMMLLSPSLSYGIQHNHDEE